MSGPGPRLSRTRTVLFGVLAVVWFVEMALWGFQPLTELWTRVWKMAPSGDPQLASALYLTHAVEAPLKGALGVLAVFGLRSRDPFSRSALFGSMALIPPLNIAFQFRAQGFPPRSTAVATLFSIMLWGAFFLFRDQPEPRDAEATDRPRGSRWEVFHDVWLFLNAAALTLLASLFLFGPRLALRSLTTCWSGMIETHGDELASLAFSNLGVGAHLLVLATASWIATVYRRGNPGLRRAVAAASTVNAGLLCLLPLRQMVQQLGARCAGSSILVLFVPLFVGWVIYAAVSYKAGPMHLSPFEEKP